MRLAERRTWKIRARHLDGQQIPRAARPAEARPRPSARAVSGSSAPLPPWVGIVRERAPAGRTHSIGTKRAPGAARQRVG